MPKPLLAAVCALALTSAACSGYARHTDPVAKTPQNYGAGIRTDTRSTAGLAAGKGTVRARVIDRATKKGLAGATVTIGRGKRAVTAVTDRRGRATLLVAPGSYGIRTTGCGADVIIDQASEGGVSLRAGQVAHAVLYVSTWSRRYGPSPSVLMSKRPPWSIGETVRLSVRIEDGCEHDLAPRVPLTAFRWRPSSNLAIVGARPERADAEGYGVISVRCTARGDANLLMYDPLRKASSVDLLLAGSGPPQGRRTCE